MCDRYIDICIIFVLEDFRQYLYCTCDLCALYKEIMYNLKENFIYRGEANCEWLI